MVVIIVLVMVEVDMCVVYGVIFGGCFVIIGYGSFGGFELGFGFDLDLVFLYDNLVGVEVSDGVCLLELGCWYVWLV